MLSFKMDYTKLCKEILDLDPKIRFAGVCDESGEIKFGGQREGLDNLLTAEETKRSNLQALARWGLRNSLSSKVGKGKYAMAEYEKIKRITAELDYRTAPEIKIPEAAIRIAKTAVKPTSRTNARLNCSSCSRCARPSQSVRNITAARNGNNKKACSLNSIIKAWAQGYAPF